MMLENLDKLTDEQLFASLCELQTQLDNKTQYNCIVSYDANDTTLPIHIRRILCEMEEIETELEKRQLM